jgi:hypothetical protein
LDFFFVGSLHLSGVQLANLFELQAEAVAERTFRSQLIEQGLSSIEGVWRYVFRLEEVAKTTLNFGFGKQGELLGATAIS